MEKNKSYDYDKENEIGRKWRTENEIKNLLSGMESTYMDAELFSISAFDEVKLNDKRGLGVYYPVYRDGSCAEAQYIAFHYVHQEGLGDIVILERANEEEVQEYEWERLLHLLRR